MAAAVDFMGTSSYEMDATTTKVFDAGSNIPDERYEIREKAYNLCREYLKGSWATVPKQEFNVTVLGGGLTNKLYICQIPSKATDAGCPHTVVLRIYGLIIQDLPAQIQESVVFSILSERKIGPHLYAVFPGGRLEEYIPCRTLSTCDLPDPVTSGQIARRLACYHQLVMPVNKEPTTLMNKLQFHMDNLHLVQFDDEYRSELLRRFLQFDIDAEVQFVKALILDTDSPIVFCHNDVQEGNLLHTEVTDESCNPIQMIDFEYSCYNHRGFDLGNHFCEWMYDYSYPKWPYYSYKQENYPTKQQQAIFIKSYLETYFASDDVSNRGKKWKLKFMIKEANRFALFSHLFWALWSVIQAKMSEIDFGYMEYAISRMESYYYMKKTTE